MNRVISVVTAFAILTGGCLHAQEMGEAAATSAGVARDNYWPNWVFLGTAVWTTAAAVTLLALDNGKSGTSH